MGMCNSRSASVHYYLAITKRAGMIDVVAADYRIITKELAMSAKKLSTQPMAAGTYETTCQRGKDCAARKAQMLVST
jgi:hypothetical protein